ncbi:hypothetical protein Ctha_1674 [Chloroherpeton thalassium ATCC 35110]|uniref:DNRLRE domain-containing protein n=1 Tax=Chloroherpeton thalassium (strain ATCC 35110 / GB-78) TaxID=517418 RepID=B3QST5_CHLT3|nr:DNRLRE domain-containing protein [Chloroherpeton thalassium]ACF14132.1 hypothetical protein Ctha_1674 [Chloroherpeton thalassium ATCC 35110]
MKSRSSFSSFLSLCGLLAVLFGTFACSSDDADLIGPNSKFITANEIFQFDSDTVDASNMTFESFAIDSGAYTSGYSFVGMGSINGTGMGKEVLATTYLNFDADFPDIDAATAMSAALVLKLDDWVDSTDGGQIQVSIYEVSDYWDEDEVRSRTPIGLGSLLGSATFNIADSSAQTISLSQAFAAALLEELQKGDDYFPDSSKGLAIVSTSGTTLARIEDDDTKLRLVLNRQTTSGETEVLSKLMDVESEAYTVSPNFSSFETDGMYVQSTTGYRTSLKFDLSWLNPEYQIANATLSFSRDTLYSTVEESNNYVSVYYSDEDGEIDTDFSSALASPDSTTGDMLFTVTVTDMVQNWASEPDNNNGFLLVAYREVSQFETWKFYNPSEDAGLRPRLTITYVVSQ